MTEAEFRKAIGGTFDEFRQRGDGQAALERLAALTIGPVLCCGSRPTYDS